MDNRIGLSVNNQKSTQRNNYISIRQKPDQDGGWGTLLQPKRFELPLFTAHRIKSRLGFEAVPASEFWQFTTSSRIRLQVNRLSEDRYANSVGLALLDQGNRRVAPLVQSASGRGEPVDIEPGTYKVVASLGIAENIKDLIFEFQATPIGARLRAAAVILLPAVATTRRPALQGVATTWPIDATGHQDSSHRRRITGQGVTSAPAAGKVSHSGFSSGLHGKADVAASGRLRLSFSRLNSLRSTGFTGQAARGTVAPVRWLEEPHNPWRARHKDGYCELNRPYVRFDGDAASHRRVLDLIQAVLG